MTAEDIANLVLLAVGLAFGLVAVRAHRRGPRPWGIGRRGAPRAYVVGSVLGAAAVAIIVALSVALGIATVDGSGGPPTPLAAWLPVVVYLALLNLVEEIVFRAFLLRGVIIALGPTRRAVIAAVISTGILTSLPYLLGPSTSPLSMISAVLGGITYGVAYLRSGGVWLSAGMRTAWNVVLGPVLGFTVSATPFVPTWFRSTLEGPSVLTGGSYGPEAGIVAVLVRIALIGVLLAAPLALVRRSSTPTTTVSRPA